MDRNAVIIVTGAAGFIGSCLTGYLNRKGYFNIIIVDDFNDETRRHNYEEKKICARVDRDELFDWLNRYTIRIDFVFHLGAQTGSGIASYPGFEKWNLEYSRQIWQYCTDKNIPLVYSSCYATDVPGAQGYDDHQPPEKLNTGSGYGNTKNEFDKWAQAQSRQQSAPSFWAGLKFFSVYGPNEYHKGTEASAVLRVFHQLRAGQATETDKDQDNQTQDFVYVKDVVDVCYWMMQKTGEDPGSLAPGIYPVGTGKARSLKELKEIVKQLLAGAKVLATRTEPVVEIGPAFPQADISKLRRAGYTKNFYSLEEGVKTYVQHFLLENKYY